MKDDKASRERIPFIEIIGWISVGWVYRAIMDALGWIDEIKELIAP